MRAIEFIEEEAPINTHADNLKRQADHKADQAKKLKQAATVEKKREQVNAARTNLMTKQRDLLKASSQK